MRGGEYFGGSRHQKNNSSYVENLRKSVDDSYLPEFYTPNPKSQLADMKPSTSESTNYKTSIGFFKKRNGTNGGDNSLVHDGRLTNGLGS